MLVALFVPYPAAGDVDPSSRSYIVVFEPGQQSVDAETAKRAKKLGFQSEHRYRAALRGFSAELTEDQAEELARDPLVAFVQPDRLLDLDGFVPLAPGEPTPPTGARRIDASTETMTREPGAPVAVIDTGIDLDHPDLNARDGKNCVDPAKPADDEDFHGTFVAGIIGARNNGHVGRLYGSSGNRTGAVGVAPGTELWAVKWTTGFGGREADLICAIDWVAENAEANGIQVANISAGGVSPSLSSCPDTTDALHLAICGLTGAGVTVVASAGNVPRAHDDPTRPHIPSAYPEVLAVTAISDSDGKPGGMGGPPPKGPDCYNFAETEDDVPATFSAFAATEAGSAHTIAAPGVCITSTIPPDYGFPEYRGSYSMNGGTSFAAPHVAAVAALCHEEGGHPGPCAHKSPGQVVKYLMQKAASYNQAHPEYGFLRDPQHAPVPGRYYGYLTRASHAGSDAGSDA